MNQTKTQLLTPFGRRAPIATLLLALLCIIAPSAARAAHGESVPTTIAPLIDDATYLVIHADLTTTTPGALVEAFGSIMMESAREVADAGQVEVMQRDLANEIQTANAFGRAFREAGGRECFVLGTFHAFGQPQPFVVAAPVPGGASADALRDVLAEFGDTRVARGFVIAGVSAAIDAMLAAPARPRPELATAWAASKGGAVQAALIPAAYTRRVVAEFVPELPAEMGGGAMMPVLEGLQWASATVTVDPAPGATLLVQSADDDAAVALRQALRGGLEFVVRQVTRGQAADPVAAAAALTPSVHGDTLTLEVDRAGARTIISCVRPPLKAARDRAERLKSMTQIRQIAMAVHIHADAHDGAWPDDIERLAQREQPYIQAEALVNPRGAHGLTGTYTYVKPTLPISSPKLRAATTVLVYETHDAWPPDGLCVGFIDGHVEWLVSEAKFRSLLEPDEE